MRKSSRHEKKPLSEIARKKRVLPKPINGGAIIDHEAPRERRFVAVQK
jgi:hypothetical protein